MPSSRNRIKAVNDGAVHVLIELLLEEDDRRICELVLVAMERLCGCAEGRAEHMGHVARIPLVSKKILRVSEVASEKAVRILHSAARHSATPRLLQEMMQVGVASRLCLLIQVDCKAPLVFPHSTRFHILLRDSQIEDSQICRFNLTVSKNTYTIIVQQ